MCGIAGLWAPGIPADERLGRLRRAVERIVHRGPDDEGVYEDGPLALGHRRLVVIDRTGGTQPFADPEGRVVGSFNGEIYNHRELRKELEAEGEQFQTRSDTEVLVRGFARWGTDAFRRFDGMFAAALWQPREQILTLVRDPAGEKPLFYAAGIPGNGEGSLCFSSEVFSLLALLPQTPPVSTEGLWSYLTLGYARSPRLLKGIEQVPPATWIAFERGRPVRQARYWRPPVEDGPRREKDALPFIRRAMRLAVQSRLEADVPLGAFLSGGLDSSIVVYEMRQAGAEDISTFNIGFKEGQGYDESPYARMAAREVNSRHHEQIFRVSEEILESVLNALDEPMADSSAIAVWVLARHARQNITVALGGDGGDEVFCGYERFAGVDLTERLPVVVRRLLQPVARFIPDTGGYGNRGERLRRLLRDSTYPGVERLLRWQSMCPPEAAEAFLRVPPPTPFRWPVPIVDRSSTGVHSLMLANFESYLGDDLLVKTDRMTMAHGLELRSPFLAKELVEAGFSLPAAGLLDRMQLKIWLKKAYEKVLPRQIVYRRKHGFGVPIHLWLRKGYQEWASSRILQASSPLYNHLEYDAVKALWQGHLAGEFDAGQRIWGLIVLDHFLRRIRP